MDHWLWSVIGVWFHETGWVFIPEPKQRGLYQITSRPFSLHIAIPAEQGPLQETKKEEKKLIGKKKARK